MSSESSTHPFTVFPEPDIVQRLPYWFGDDLEALEVNLSDSTTGKRILLPGRGRYCDHIDVVDVLNSTGAKEPGEIDWMCPVCGLEYTDSQDIIVDDLLRGILSELDLEDPDGKVRAINLNVDGTWSHVSENPEDRLPIRRKKRSRLTLDEAKAVVSGETAASPKAAVELSDSSDDEPGPVIDLDSD